MKAIQKTVRSFLFTLGVLFSFLFIQVSSHAKIAPPTPPPHNPHPPTSQADKARVNFAINAVKLSLMKDSQGGSKKPQAFSEVKVYVPEEGDFFDKDSSCLKTPDCYNSDLNFTSEVTRLITAYGKVTEMKHAHIIPWSFENFKKNRKKTSRFESHLSNQVILADIAIDPQRAEEPIMQAPKLKSDEYMVHIYVKFDKKSDWHHLDVILTEDANGKLGLRHFFIAPMRASLPPGVIC